MLFDDIGNLIKQIIYIYIGIYQNVIIDILLARCTLYYTSNHEMQYIYLGITDDFFSKNVLNKFNR